MIRIQVKLVYCTAYITTSFKKQSILLHLIRMPSRLEFPASRSASELKSKSMMIRQDEIW